jgi:hypothetical protein
LTRRTRPRILAGGGRHTTYKVEDLAIACPGDPYALDRSNAARILVGHHPDDYLGLSLDGAHDIDGDGFMDLVISAPDDDSFAENGGVVYLVPGPLL